MDGHRPLIRVGLAVAPRDTFDGVGPGRKTGSEVGEAIRWGHFFFPRSPAIDKLFAMAWELDGRRGTMTIDGEHRDGFALMRDPEKGSARLPRRSAGTVRSHSLEAAGRETVCDRREAFKPAPDATK